MAYGQPQNNVYEAKLILTKLSGLSSRDLLARLLFGEARGEVLAGQVAVANVVMNRVKLGGWYGLTVKDVMLKPWQFSCFNEDDPNLRLTASPPMREPYTLCEMIAELALDGLLKDNTDNSTHYFNPDVVPGRWPKPWNRAQMVFRKKIGRHEFYEEVR